MSHSERYGPVELALLVAVLVAFAVTPLVVRLAFRLGAIDEPGEDRRVHKLPTPRMGGVAVLLGVLTSTVLFVDWQIAPGFRQNSIDQLIAVLGVAAAVTLLGVADDVRQLHWRSKLTGQFVVAFAVVLLPLLGVARSVVDLVLVVRFIDPPLLHPVELPGWLGILLSVIWIVALMNMVNFIDGVDGLAAGTCAISAATFAVVAASYGRGNIAILAAATAGGALGFLPHNFRAKGARIFLGDSGSMLLGYLLAVIAIQGVLKTAAAVSLVIPLALLAVPILDTLFVISKRVKYRLPVSHADRWHLHHRLLNVGYSPRRVTISFWMWSASMSALALALRFVEYGNSRHWRPEGLALLAVFVLLALALSIYLATTLEIIKRRHVRERNAATAASRVVEAGGGD